MVRDALCERFGVDNSNRTKHGALLDAEILAEIYLELIGARQAQLGLAESSERRGNGRDGDVARRERDRKEGGKRREHRAARLRSGDGNYSHGGFAGSVASRLTRKQAAGAG